MFFEKNKEKTLARKSMNKNKGFNRNHTGGSTNPGHARENWTFAMLIRCWNQCETVPTPCRKGRATHSRPASSGHGLCALSPSIRLWGRDGTLRCRWSETGTHGVALEGRRFPTDHRHGFNNSRSPTTERRGVRRGSAAWHWVESGRRVCHAGRSRCCSGSSVRSCRPCPRVASPRSNRG